MLTRKERVFGHVVADLYERRRCSELEVDVWRLQRVVVYLRFAHVDFVVETGLQDKPKSLQKIGQISPKRYESWKWQRAKVAGTWTTGEDTLQDKA